ncbi:glycosyltransferase involved in cell wall biosynthesis [Herbaspirillum rubrisubalbicans]|uniref:glycosyltransferase n=1 Tax=Herbaspirillum rubrisubalbicans TaxID=80842 RepID=UPI0020A0DB46|nr:glycosyltransferase [Herbaspirillum rubrisubalbicans]MCP1575834.1 glycosyltransferase involved in cell wall biosynthesis [Herbaspirillum rubrisubalbicans]
MRIVIDMQGAQSPGSRNRGIGRYSMAIAKSIVRNRGQHEILLVLNARYGETIEPIRDAFKDLLPGENIRVWHSVEAVAHGDQGSVERRQAAELVFEAFLQSLQPDFVYITSLFEGQDSDTVTSVGQLGDRFPVAVTLYDLIPYIYPSIYLQHPNAQAWYQDKIEHLKRAAVCLSISESSRQEGLQHLSLPADGVVNISTDADQWFHPVEVSTVRRQALAQEYRLDRPFVLYTGGIDHRKNVEGLIRAYGQLPTELRQQYQLAIVCSIQPAARKMLEAVMREQGLEERDVVLTGFVSDEDLRDFYNLCSLFVFPSWHEGFGLPALEAMRCGAPVIAANTSSLPEVIGWDEALFNPHDDQEIAELMRKGLEDVAFREALKQHGQQQATKFSWDESGRRALRAMEAASLQRLARNRPADTSIHRRKLAYVSPLAPQRSGISDYSGELLPALSKFYDIDVVVAQAEVTDPWVLANCKVRSAEWLVNNAEDYERVIYHFGNSEFHQHMFDLLKIVPGVVVLHDFFLSGIMAHMDLNGSVPGAFSRALYSSHGYAAVRNRHCARDISEVIWEYPCSRDVAQDSLGMIVHSASSVRLAKRWYSDDQSGWTVVPQMRDSQQKWGRDAARRALGFSDDDFLVCSFGMLGPTRLNRRLLDAWLDSTLANDKTCHLVFVGENHGGDYGAALTKLIADRAVGANVRITGWADTDTFNQYLAAADVGAQLRTLSRGESSRTVLDCMAYGKPVIVNANGSMADLNPDAVWMMPDQFGDQDLVEALETLRNDEARRTQMGAMARDVILTQHDPLSCAMQYRDAIERFYETALLHPAFLARTIVSSKQITAPDALLKSAVAIVRNFPPANRCRQLLVDVTTLRGNPDAQESAGACAILKSWLEQAPVGYRVEPIYLHEDGQYRYARDFVAQLLGYAERGLEDEPIDYWREDLLLHPGSASDDRPADDDIAAGGVGIQAFASWERALSDAHLVKE